MKKEIHFDSQVIHAGQSHEEVTGAVMPPIFLSSTYAQESPGKHKGFEYTRSHNPTRYALERCIARLEGSTLTQEQDASFGGFAFSSGMAAIGTVLELLDSGDHVIAMDDLYGGTHRLFNKVRKRSSGLQFTFTDLTDLQQLEDAIQPSTRLIWVESPTNPMLKLVDLAGIAAIVKDRNILLACDNTFATPALQQPLRFGFDIVMHSATKYLSGHSDVVSGVLVTNQQELAERIRFVHNSLGPILGPFDSYLVLRGIKTLALRMRRHCQSALRIAQWLEGREEVANVLYPALPSHPQYAIAQKQMSIEGIASGRCVTTSGRDSTTSGATSTTSGSTSGGGVITCVLKGGIDFSRSFLERLEIFTLAESLGGVESLVEHPAIMTHASVPKEVRASLGIDDGLVRFSVGIEDCDDLIADLEQALT